MTIVAMDIQDSRSSDGCEKDWLDIGGIRCGPLATLGQHFIQMNEMCVISYLFETLSCGCT